MPRKPEFQAKAHINITCEQALKQRAVEAAALADQDLSTWIRGLIERRLAGTEA